MSALDLTSDFNAASSFFSWLFRLFTGGPSSDRSSPSNSNADSGNSFFSGIENFLKYVFSGFTSNNPAPRAPAGSQNNNQPAPRTFMGRLSDDFSAARDRVSKIYHGVAFDISRAVNTLKNECHSSPTNYCLAHVEDALDAAGLRFGGKKIEDVMPVRNGSHWAKDLAPVLERDNRFDEVTNGYGARFNSNYTPRVGDIAVWTGARYGHTQMFTGYDKDGKQMWISDFKTSPDNWTGLANPDSHGQFKIFRQKTDEDATLMARNQPASPRPAAPNV